MVLDFQKTQQSFASRIRHNNSAPCPDGIDVERMKVYEECFFNGINELLSNAFPVIYEVLTEFEWHSLIKKFYATHHSQSPLFYEIPQEFLEYLIKSNSLVEKYPFIIELAHYEWMELTLDLAIGEISKPDKEIDLDNNKFILSPLAEVIAYNYPVHKIKKNYIPQKKIVFICIYRNYKYEIKFIELNKLSARILLMLKGNALYINDVMQELINNSESGKSKKIIDANIKVIKKLILSGVIYQST